MVFFDAELVVFANANVSLTNVHEKKPKQQQTTKTTTPTNNDEMLVDVLVGEARREYDI